MTGHIEPMVGRYVHVEIDGEMHRIYFEENGAGIPLVCLHTAGSDGRQWRHLLADEEFSRKFRIIAFDMPWHGKSNPPAGWTGEEYRLTTARYTATVRAFCHALGLATSDVSFPYVAEWAHGTEAVKMLASTGQRILGAATKLLEVLVPEQRGADEASRQGTPGEREPNTGAGEQEAA